jgi:hypothetical protein
MIHEEQALIARKVLFGKPEKKNVKLSPNTEYVSYLAYNDRILYQSSVLILRMKLK